MEKTCQSNVEVQVGSQQTWPQRMLYYWPKMYAHQLMQGDEYKKLNPAICVVFLGFSLDKREGYMRRVVAWDEYPCKFRRREKEWGV